MINLIVKIIVSAIAILITSALSIGVQVDGFMTAAWVAIVIGILDWAINKFTGIDASPFGRGAVGFIVAAIILYITGRFVDGFNVSVIGAVIGAAILGIVDSFLPADKKVM
ncbi:phage holin family protein [Peptoniphilus sp. MSJ-1]|uniref:Phage holin family protein n=1 Tax=Peptoniphilus ovalis TaxID=2841503 RepID=A0ABS6FE63_9FIRM|nr:phage holin family protein [Peptoniphilus ovalis]MBU5668457.1 phage holin family protein [Peptoniphilus ovalis]